MINLPMFGGSGPGDPGAPITVAIPTHPGRGDVMDPRSLLGQAVNSVFAQTWRPTGGISLAMDLDGKGAAVTRQEALNAVGTEWVAFLDSDDMFMPRHLEKLYNFAQDTDADYVYAWYKIIDQLGNELHYDPVFPPGHYLDPWDPQVPRQTTITILVRTELAKEVGFVTQGADAVMPDGNRAGEDYAFTLGCNRLGRIEHLVDHTWWWRHGDHNTSGLPGRGDARWIR